MRHRWLIVLLVCILAGPSVLIISAADPPDTGIALIGKGEIPGSALDLSGLDGEVCSLALFNFGATPRPVCVPRATLGGFGSGLAYTGHDNVFIGVPDRGPFDGRTADEAYLDRFHFFHIDMNVGASFPNITTTLLDTRFFKNEQNTNFVGSAFAFSGTNPLETLRLDPEAVTVAPDGTFFISDEYGPYIFKFDRQGHLLRRIPVPQKFLLELFNENATGTQSGEVDAGGNSLELQDALNLLGRQANRGMEGLTITPDGRTLVGIMQNALLQDNALTFGPAPDHLPSRVSVNTRILTLDLVTGATAEYVYSLENFNQGRGVNEILAINNHEFLVLERDNRTQFPTPTEPVPPAVLTPQAPNIKTIYKVDLKQIGVTDVSGRVGLATTKAGLASMSPPVVPLTKEDFDPVKKSRRSTQKTLNTRRFSGLCEFREFCVECRRG